MADLQIGEVSANSADAPPAAFLDLLALAADLRQRWLWIATGAMVGLLCTLIYLNFATVRYAASLRVTPSSSTQNSLSGTLGRLGGLASLAGVQVRQGNEGATSFELYLDRIRSREIAAVLVNDDRIARTVFDREWNTATNRFEDRPGPLRLIRNLLYTAAGQSPPAWIPPNAQRMQDYLQKTIAIIPPGAKDPPITTLAMRAEDPEFARYLLGRLNQQADTDVRAAALIRAEQYAEHLAEKLTTTQIAEHRLNLSEALLEQERSIMMANASGPFAAVPLEPATSSERPVSPLVLPSLVIGLVIGAVLGVLAVVAAHIRRSLVLSKRASQQV